MDAQHSIHPAARSRATWRWVAAALVLMVFQVVSVLIVEW